MRDETPGRTRGRALQALRLRTWSADPYCKMCGKLTEYPGGFELDHVVPLFKGGDDTTVQILCPPCHGKKTEKDLGYKPKPRFDANGRVVWDR